MKKKPRKRGAAKRRVIKRPGRVIVIEEREPDRRQWLMSGVDNPFDWNVARHLYRLAKDPYIVFPLGKPRRKKRGGVSHGRP